MTRQYLVRWLPAGSMSISQAVLHAPDPTQVRAELEREGHTVLSVVLAPRSWRSRLWPDKATPLPYALFCRELRTLIVAGMTVVEAVDTLGARERDEKNADRSLPLMLLAHLQQGKALSNALSLLPQAPAVLIAAVRAGERTSDLAQALEDYLRFDTMIGQLKRKVVSAAIYPALVTTLGVGISLFLLLVVMPNFARMYEQVRGQGQASASWLIELSLWVSDHQGTTFAAMALVAVALGIWIRSGAARRQTLGWLQRPRWVQRRVKDFRLAMLYQAVALMLKGGYPLPEALSVASQSALDPVLAGALKRALENIERGAPVATSLHTEFLCDEVDRRLMAAAERNGDFHLAADVVSRMHAERFELFVERLTRIVEPVLLMAVALMVGSIVVMMYLPVFDMATRLR